MSKKNQGPQTPDGYTGYIDVSGIGAPPMPQVNLLPPDVRSRRAMGGVRIRALLVVVAVVAVLAVIIVSSLFSLTNAEADVAEKEARVVALQSEMTQYAEVPKVKSQLAGTLTAREFGMSNEFMWAEYFQAIQSVAPEGWTLTDFSAVLPTPMEDAQGNANPLAQPSVAVISFTGRAATVPDVAEWLEGMATITGFSDPLVSTSEIAEEEGVVYYETMATVQVNIAAFHNRFTAVEGEES